MEQRSPEWFAARKNRITGSAVGAILGLSPYSTPDDVMRRMVREKFDAPSEFTGNVATEWGVANEAGAIKEYEMETGVTVKPAGFYTHMHWLGASPDGLVGDEFAYDSDHELDESGCLALILLNRNEGKIKMSMLIF